MRILAHVLLVALALILASHIIPGIAVSGLYIAIVTAIVLGLLNLTVRPILFILTLPLNIVTFGLFSFVLNALMLIFVASFIQGFAIVGFIPALLAALLISIVSAIGDSI